MLDPYNPFYNIDEFIKGALMAITKIVLVLLTVSFSYQSFPWGPTGHRIVGEIAQKEISPKVYGIIRLLLDDESLAQVSTWADEIKSDPENYRHTFSWHYMTWPTGQDEYEYHGEGELLQSIQDNLSILKNETKPKEERAIALKFLVHLVGDLHQPLHVGNGQDMGGNTCQVIFHGERTSLHALWDEKLIEKTLLSYTEYVEFLMEKRKSLKGSEMENEILDWARESRTLRDQIYPEEVDKPKVKKSLKQDYCRRDLDHTDSELPKLGYKYSYQFREDMERRLLLGGIRLGALLNEAFKK